MYAPRSLLIPVHVYTKSQVDGFRCTKLECFWRWVVWVTMQVFYHNFSLTLKNKQHKTVSFYQTCLLESVLIRPWCIWMESPRFYHSKVTTSHIGINPMYNEVAFTFSYHWYRCCIYSYSWDISAIRPSFRIQDWACCPALEYLHQINILS